MRFEFQGACRMVIPAEERRDEIPLLPATGLPTQAQLEEEEALQKAAQSQLTDVRKAADSWRTGLGALIALVATIFFIKGRESVFDISVGWRWILAIVLVAAFCAAIYAAWAAMRAAFGEYEVVEWDEVLAEGGWASYQASVAESAVAHLENAQKATILSLIGLVLAVLLTWFAPKPAAAETIASVTTRDNTVVCGKLTGGISRGLPLQLEGKAPIPLDRIVAIAIVEEC
jgi:hypothetical protein